MKLATVGVRDRVTRGHRQKLGFHVGLGAQGIGGLVLFRALVGVKGAGFGRSGSIKVQGSEGVDLFGN